VNKIIIENRYIVELEKGVYIAPWDGDPGRTIILNNAKGFYKEKYAKEALVTAQTYRPFNNAKIKLKGVGK